MNNLARVARATNQAEAEFVQTLLEAGIASMLRRSPGFEVPDMLAAGPRDVMVPSTAHDAARQVLLQAEIVTDDRGRRPTHARTATGPRAPDAPSAMRIYPPAGSPSRGCPRVGAATTSRGCPVARPRPMRVAQRPPDDPRHRHATTAPEVAGATISSSASPRRLSARTQEAWYYERPVWHFRVNASGVPTEPHARVAASSRRAHPPA
jgi:hypothetical protein